MSSRRPLFLVIPALGIATLILFLSHRGSKRSVRMPESPTADAPPTSTAASSAPETTPAPPPPSPLPPSSATQKPTVDSLAATMHALEDSNPERALELARQGQALWPSGPRAAEFAATEVKCLYRLGKPSEGRGAAEAMVNKYPTSPWAREVESQTGAHPHVNH